MAYGLTKFCSDLNTALKEKGASAVPEIAENLKKLLANKDFVAEIFNDDTPKGKCTLYHDADSDAYVLAHVHFPGGRGKPHSHGESWAIYGCAKGYTLMTEWERANPENEDRTVLRQVSHYKLGEGDAKAYGSGMIHSTEHPEKAWVIRLTGTKLSEIPRFHFDPAKDSILEDA
jgi:predicted metal-dependent enzyme (double-stranded beta helix superfamily)